MYLFHFHTVEVRGSSPLSPTIFSACNVFCQAKRTWSLPFSFQPNFSWQLQPRLFDRQGGMAAWAALWCCHSDLQSQSWSMAMAHCRCNCGDANFLSNCFRRCGTLRSSDTERF